MPSYYPTFIPQDNGPPVVAVLLSDLIGLGLHHLENALFAYDEVVEISDPIGGKAYIVREMCADLLIGGL